MMLPSGILLLSIGAAVSAPVSEWPSAGFIAEKSRHGINIRGHLLSGRARDTLISDAAENGIPIKSIEYGRHIVLPRWWSSAVHAMLPAVNGLQSGEIRISRAGLSINGAVTEGENWTKSLQALRSQLPDSVQVSSQVIEVPLEREPAVCARLFAGLNREPLLFRRRSSSPKTADHGRLNRLAAVLRRCKGISIRIVGHSDAFGLASRNQIVSDQRASAVAQYLIKRGVATSQLSSEGRGDREPIATNDTWEGRNLNRRVTIDRAD